MSIEPCPFCGEAHDLGIGRGTEDREGFPTWLYCGTCGAQGPWFYTRDKAHWTCTALAAERSGWNTRTGHPQSRRDDGEATKQQETKR